MKRILIVGCGFPQLSLVKTARRLGLHVIGADANPQAVAVKHCHEFFEVSTNHVDGLASLVERAHVEAVTTTGSEVALRATAQLAARVKLPFYADPETVRRCQDKDVMRLAYTAAGLAAPAFARCETFEHAAAFADAQGFPLVVKPSRGWGQRGVARIDRASELAPAFEEARVHSTSAGLPIVIVEKWLVGREYSVNGWVDAGRMESYCVTERITVPGNKPLGVMIAEVYPSGLAPEDELRVVDEARRGAAALGHVRGPCYSQLVLGPTGCVLFETAARLGGGFDADVTRLASGVDLYARVISLALGHDSLEPQGATLGARANAVIAKFLVAKPGRVRGVDGLDEARTAEGIDDSEVFVSAGGRVMPLTDSAKRAAYVLAHGASRDEAMRRADASLARIRIETYDDVGP